MAGERTAPYSAHNFLVDIDGDGKPNDPLGGFSHVSGLNQEFNAAEYRGGNDKEMHVRKIPRLHKVGDVTLKRGVVYSSDLWSWMTEVRTENVAAQRTIVITLNNEAGEGVKSWKLRGCIPIKYTGATLAGKGGGDVAIEELTLSVEGIDRTTL